MANWITSCPFYLFHENFQQDGILLIYLDCTTQETWAYITSSTLRTTLT
jgi:hypothetical protein